MADYATLKTSIQAAIKQNGNNEITGPILQQTLLAMINSLGAGYQFIDVATPETNPGTPDENLFYIAYEAGTYTNFGAIEIDNGLAVIYGSGSSWSVKQIFVVDDSPNRQGTNLITSGGAFIPLIYLGTNNLGWIDKGINVNTGTELISSDRKSTDFLPIDSVGECFVKNKISINYYLIFYSTNDASGFISSLGWNNAQSLSITSIAPVGAKYVRIMVNNSVATNYLNTYMYGSNTWVNHMLDTINASLQQEVLNREIAINGVEELVELEWTLGAINQTSGVDYESTTFKRTQFISVEDFNTVKGYKYPHYYKVFQYSSDDQSSFIGVLPGSGTSIDTYYSRDIIIGDGDITFDANCAYVRLMCVINDANPDPEFVVGIFIDGEVQKRNQAIATAIQQLKNSYPIFSLSKNELVVVDANGKGDYTTIEDALHDVNDTEEHPVTIIIMPGTYYPAPKIYGTPGAAYGPYKEVNRYVNIIGVYRDACILRGSVGYYGEYGDFALLRLNGNVLIKNLTLINTCDDYDETIEEKGWTSTQEQDVNNRIMAYCIHCDALRNKGTTITIENCKMYNDHFSAVGWGLRPGALRIANCVIETNVDPAIDQRTGFPSYGSIYGHLSNQYPEDNTNNRLEIVRNVIINRNHRNSVKQMSALSAGTDYSKVSSFLQFIGNVIKTTDTQHSLDIVTVDGYPLINAIDEMSYGNNVESMNVL